MKDTTIHSLRDRQKEKLNISQSPAEEKPKASADEEIAAPVKKKKRFAKKLSKLIVFVAVVFLVGGLGGVWLDRILLPNLLIKYPALNQYAYLKKVNERTTVVRETEEVKITQETGTADAIEKVLPSVAEILVKDASGQFVKIGTGIILTSDGYLITPLKNIYTGQNLNTEIQVKLKDGRTDMAKIISQDTDYSLAMLKIEENNLPVIPYADSDSLRLGEKLIIVDDAIVTDIISKIVEDYKMPGSTDSSLQKRIQIVQDLGQNFSGAAVINLEGKLVGVEQETNIIIPIDEIKNYIAQGTAKQ